ncbi:lysozyme inhibitor LprI family protein [Jannaschia pohangensis]|uniref:Lysozyme inhibitor LprI-like N-terminal domain-containing protein n=1 Tax=Jannaschia pohangensis TaxID=390807 RepID=A0A1I3Q6N1_9RHOB|nr:lysozyme inhibitor LprI family protein [Jannaschia pohangensis]SFJ29538.1 Protein of unknown function [Jannaschia pohangensis]
MSRVPTVALLCVLAAGAAPARAGDFDAAPFRAMFETCVAQTGTARDLETCRNAPAQTCQLETEGGRTTLGTTACNAMEADLWETLLSADLVAHLAWAEALDARERPFFDASYSKRSDSLLDAQRAWTAFRDAECRMVHDAWGSGSMRNVAASRCHADLTAARVIALRQLTEGVR